MYGLTNCTACEFRSGATMGSGLSRPSSLRRARLLASFRMFPENNRSVGPSVINLSLQPNEGNLSRHRWRAELRQDAQSAQVSLHRRQKIIGPPQKSVRSHGRQGRAFVDLEGGSGRFVWAKEWGAH